LAFRLLLALQTLLLVLRGCGVFAQMRNEDKLKFAVRARKHTFIAGDNEIKAFLPAASLLI
jgi:hypothetical protein